MPFAANSRGFTYLGVMFVVALLALTSTLAAVVWSTVQKRENERELVFVGHEFQAAIERYARRSNGVAPTYPRRLEDLLVDTRSLRVERHLRRLYHDPMTGNAHWGLVKLADGGIAGVHSLSPNAPLQRGVLARGLSFPRAASYRDWRFVAPGALGLLGLGAGVDAPAPPAANDARRANTPDTLTAVSSEQPSPEAPPIATPRPTQRDYRERSPEACARIAAYEQQVCAEQAQRIGEEAGRDCQDSAVARVAACPFGESVPLPPLIVSPK